MSKLSVKRREENFNFANKYGWEKASGYHCLIMLILCDHLQLNLSGDYFDKNKVNLVTLMHVISLFESKDIRKRRHFQG